MIARPAAALGAAILGTAAGIGWLYLLRHSAALDAGPGLREALPLQRLAGGATQPLLRLVVAWLPTGLIAGLALTAAGYRRRAARAAVMFVLTLILLVALGAMSDAVTASERLRDHLAAQPGTLAIWLAAALVAAGAAIPPARRGE
jgi:hypothetical protein